MSTNKINVSVYFQYGNRDDYFLFQVINFGKRFDDLKFVFTHPDSGVGGIYSENKEKYTGAEIVRPQPEITYHHDGSLLQKFPSYSPRTPTEYRNPSGTGSRRISLGSIAEWSPFIKYTIGNHKLCKKPTAHNKILIPPNERLFNGLPFECFFFLGRSANPTPKAKISESVFRIKDVADSLDLLLCFVTSKYQGQVMQIGESEHRVHSVNNIIEIVEKTSSIT